MIKGYTYLSASVTIGGNTIINGNTMTNNSISPKTEQITKNETLPLPNIH